MGEQQIPITSNPPPLPTHEAVDTFFVEVSLSSTEEMNRNVPLKINWNSLILPSISQKKKINCVFGIFLSCLSGCGGMLNGPSGSFITSLRRDSPSKIVPDFLCATL